VKRLPLRSARIRREQEILAAGSVTAHLCKLEREGRVLRSGSGDPLAAAVLRALGSSHPGFVGERTRTALERARDASPDPDLRRAAAQALADLRVEPRVTGAAIRPA